MPELNRLDARRDLPNDIDGFPQLEVAPMSPHESRVASEAAYAKALNDHCASSPTLRGSSYATFIAAATAATATGSAQRTARVQDRLDAFRESACGPYKAEGQTVLVPPQFAMNGGADHENAKDLKAIANGVRLGGAVAAVHVGRGTPEQVTKLTQALIDAGKLPSGPGSLTTRIHQMQWAYGIGFDCAGYSQQAAVAASGKPRGALFSQGLTDAIKFDQFHRVAVTAARAGDMFVLKPPGEHEPGHKTIVYSHTAISNEAARDEIQQGGGNAALFGKGGPVHRYELDSSWGAGSGNTCGGLRREPALYNEATKMWAYRNTATEEWTVGAKPFGHPIDGTYRPNADK